MPEISSSAKTKVRLNFKINPILSYDELMKLWTWLEIQPFLVYMYYFVDLIPPQLSECPLEGHLRTPTMREKSDFKSGTSHDKIIYKAKKNPTYSIVYCL